MKHFVIAVGLAVCWAATIRADDAALKKTVAGKVEEMNNALINGSFAKIVDLTHPKVIEMAGGRDKMIAEIESTMKQLKEKGVEFRSAKLGDISDPAAGGDDIFVVVPFDLELKAPGGKLRQKTFVIGISPDKGKAWTFVNGDLDAKSVKQMLPNLPDALKLPERQMPKFEKD